MFNFALGKLGAAIKAGTGSAGVVPLFSRDYEATGSLGADATLTRASTATVTDFEDLVKIAKSGEARFEGLRRVENLIYHSEDLTLNAAVVSAGVSATSTELTFTNTTGEYRKNVNTTKTYFIVRVTFKARRISGDGTQIRIDYGNIRSWNFDIDDNLTRYSTMFSGNLTGTTNWVDFKLNNGTGLVLEVTEIQVEDVTGQTNQNPSEYVSVGVLSAPYHGANVDGVKYFATENGNTVTDDVVTEGTGAAITGGALLMEPAATNLVTYSAEFDNVGWQKLNTTVTANAAESPNGTLDADQIAFNTLSNALISRSANPMVVSPSASYVFSVWLRAVSGTFKLKISATDGVTWTGATISDEITLDENWTRHHIVITTRADQTRIDPVIGDEGATAYTLPATGSVYAWGAELKAGTTPTSYIPTSGSTVTRAADALSYSGIAADNETRAITDAGTVDVDDWDGVVDATINGADNIAEISSITVYTTGERPA